MFILQLQIYSETFSHSREVFILHHYNIKQMLHETAESAIRLCQCPIELPKRRFQTFLDISLPEKLIGKSHRPQNKTFIRGASPGVSDEL